MSETDKPSTAPKEKGRRRSRRVPTEPSPGAQHFLDVLDPPNISRRALKESLEPWFKQRGVKWRSVADFLSGAAREFSQTILLAELVRERTGAVHDPSEFRSPVGIRNFPAEFCTKSVASSFLRAVQGIYTCIRPGTHVLAGMEDYNPETSSDAHELELTYYGDFQPGTFRYTTLNAKRAPLGTWRGYAVTKFPFIFLSGFCVDAEDASYFLLRPHPDRDHSQRMLVGIQSLLLSHPEPRDPKHAVSRHIVAIKKEFADSSHIIEAAHKWIRTNRQESSGLLVDLGDHLSQKT